MWEIKSNVYSRRFEPVSYFHECLRQTGISLRSNSSLPGHSTWVKPIHDDQYSRYHNHEQVFWLPVDAGKSAVFKMSILKANSVHHTFAVPVWTNVTKWNYPSDVSVTDWQLDQTRLCLWNWPWRSKCTSHIRHHRFVELSRKANVFLCCRIYFCIPYNCSRRPPNLGSKSS